MEKINRAEVIDKLSSMLDDLELEDANVQEAIDEANLLYSDIQRDFPDKNKKSDGAVVDDTQANAEGVETTA